MRGSPAQGRDARGVPPSRCLFAVSGVVDLFHRRVACLKQDISFGVFRNGTICRSEPGFQFTIIEDMVRCVVPLLVIRDLLAATVFFWVFSGGLICDAYMHLVYAQWMPVSSLALVFWCKDVSPVKPMTARDVHLGGCYHLFACGVRSKGYVDRTGVEVSPFSLGGFTRVLSIRVRWDDHIN